MSQDWQGDVEEFHKEVIGDNFAPYPHLEWNKRELRISLMREELQELETALHKGDLPGIADGAADLIVVTLGTMVTYGIDLRPIWDEVHRTNMLKKDGPIRADGKKLKPPDWKGPEIARLLEEQ